MIPCRYLQLLIMQFTKGNISMTGTLKGILENLEWMLLSLTIIWGQSLLLLNSVIFFFFLRARALKFYLLEGVASLLAKQSPWNDSLGVKKKKVENCLIKPIFQPTNPVILTVLNCWPLPSVSCNSVAGTLPANTEPCYLIRIYLLKVIMVHDQSLAMWNTISSF